MSDEEKEEFKEKIQSVQVPRKPFVDQKDAAGSTQTHHTSGRVDADIHPQTIVASASVPMADEGGAE